MTSVIYMHGFRSSPLSPKVRFFREKAVEKGIDFHAPDLNYPDFENMTITSMIEKFSETLKECDDDVVVIASSLGTIPVLNAIDRKAPYTEKIRKIVLLSATFDYKKNSGVSDELFSMWKEQGYYEFEHFSYQENARLKYAFIEDMDRYDTEAILLRHPTLVLHGTDDEIVAIDNVKEYLFNQDNVTFVPIEKGDHVLTDHLPFIWQQIDRFISG